ncbi:Coiled-coil domain-containing protein 94 [Microtus ochrogaster]|uniref:Splicing factor YJU2 n=1 Tax=Microtus ochrogaster TaxID=79684 RepID=A0A8J6G005_MICOH|nr:Coiled-coil domain-containing protein 94 [Microtus ochrogaster]
MRNKTLLTLSSVAHTHTREPDTPGTFIYCLTYRHSGKEQKRTRDLDRQKYYPPDFDPSKIPKLKLPKDRQYVVRLMAPFNMRCKTCGEYIYKGKKFNARKETVQNEAYLGLPIFRFYIKCTRCLAEITFKDSPHRCRWKVLAAGSYTDNPAHLCVRMWGRVHRCKTCGEYIYKGKKFNARKETVQNEAYLGLPIFRFYIKCTRCLAEITFKTDPENTDYTMEHGATRNFQAEKLLEEEEKRVQKEREDEELNNPMKVLENRTKDSKLEMEVLENLQELKDLNQRQAHVDFEAMLLQHRLSQEQWRQQQEEEDERETAALLEEARHRRLLEDSDSEDEAPPSRPRAAAKPNPTAILDEAPKTKRKAEAVGSRAQLAGLVVPKKMKAEANGGSEQVQMPAVGAPESRKTANLAPQTPGASSLSQLGAYGDSEDSDS